MFTSLFLAFWAAWYVLQERKRYERELRKSREHYRGLLEATPNAVALYDSNLCLLECNSATAQLYGFGISELIGKPPQTVPPGKQAELRELAERARSGSTVLNVETKRQRKDGTLFDVLLSLLLFRQDGSDGRHVVVRRAPDLRRYLSIPCPCDDFCGFRPDLAGQHTAHPDACIHSMGS